MSKTDYANKIIDAVAPRADEDVKTEVRGALLMFSKHTLKQVSERGVSHELVNKLTKAADVFAKVITQ